MEEEFAGYTVTAHCKPDFNFAHNLRIPGSVFNQEHIGVGEHENWLGGDEIDPEKLFNKIFQKAVAEYNKAQKRSDRKIKSYYQKVLDDGRFGKTKTLKYGNREKQVDISRKPIYEFIFQIGNRDVHPDSQDVKKLFKQFVFTVFKKKFGKNFRIIRVDYHDDEYSEDKNGNYTIKSPAHVHVAFVPVIQKDPEQLKGKGVLKLRLQHSLSQACEAAGFTTNHLSEEERKIKNDLKAQIRDAKEKGNKELKEELQKKLLDYTTYTNQQRFEETVRMAFAEYLKYHGIPIDLTPGKKHSHQSKELFKINKEKEKLEKRKLEIDLANKDLDSREAELAADENAVSTREDAVKNREDAVDVDEKEIAKKWSEIKDREYYVKENSQEVLKVCDEIEEDKKSPTFNLKTFAEKVKKALTGAWHTIKKFKDEADFWRSKTAEDLEDIAKEIRKNKYRNAFDYYTEMMKKNFSKIKTKTIDKDNDQDITR